MLEILSPPIPEEIRQGVVDALTEEKTLKTFTKVEILGAKKCDRKLPGPITDLTKWFLTTFEDLGVCEKRTTLSCHTVTDTHSYPNHDIHQDFAKRITLAVSSDPTLTDGTVFFNVHPSNYRDFLYDKYAYNFVEYVDGRLQPKPHVQDRVSFTISQPPNGHAVLFDAHELHAAPPLPYGVTRLILLSTLKNT